MCQPTVSFAWVEGGAAVEWEVEYGPVAQVYAAAAGDHEQAGHIFTHHRTDCGLCFSQLAVSSSHLPDAAIAGNFEYVWSILKRWHQRNKDGHRTYGEDA